MCVYDCGVQMEFVFGGIIVLSVLVAVSEERIIANSVDDAIRMQLMQFSQSAVLADGIVLAGTIVEGGPVAGRRRKILGGRQVNPAHSGAFKHIGIPACPPATLWYACEKIVATECEVIRYLLFRSGVCICKVNVC